MKRFNKHIILSLCFLLVFSSIPVYGETSPVIIIDSVEDLIDFSKACVLDTFSENMIVHLEKDLDLTGIALDSIPSFSGVFDGKGHTIKGLTIKDVGSNRGLFRYLELTGMVKNLHVKGSIDPTGTKSEVGGVVGTNYGVIMNVTFTGDVSGLTAIGGITGVNEKTGSVIKCESNGLITGEHYTGGIVGENKGYVGQNINYAEVNTTDDAIPNNDMASYDLEKLNLESESAEDIEAQTDTGGIAGYSTGILEGNSNYGAIGYPHVGYNIGGIVGRHNGYITSNTNYGSVYGRKDVGGIVGQMEPYVHLLFSEDTLSDLDEALTKMNQTLEDLVEDAYGNSKDVSNQLEKINQQMDQTSNHLEDLLDNTSSYADDAGETLNEGFERLHKVILQLEYVVDEFKAGSEDLTVAMDYFETGFDEFAKGSEALEDSIGDLQDAMYDLELAGRDADKALNKIQIGLNNIEKALETTSKYDDGMALVLEGLEDLEEASADANNALQRITDYYQANGTMLGFDYGPSIEMMNQATEHLEVAIPKLRNGFTLLASEFEDDMALLSEAFSWFNSAGQDLSNMNEDLKAMKEDLDEAIQNLEDGAEYMSEGMRQFSDASGALSDASEHMTMAFEYFDMILNEQQKKPALSFPILSEYTEESSEIFFDDLSNLSLMMTDLNTLLNQSSDETYDNLRALNEDYKAVADIIRDGINALSFDEVAIFEDISDLENDGEIIQKGITIKSINKGEISGDVDVGGIVGAMAIEYDFDPEDDIVKKGNQSFNFKYQTKAILLNSKNTGKVISKKDYSGGIVGRMDLGLVQGCENYSHVSSTDGNYVGGIAGSSGGVIRNVYSISRLSGKKYIGGIAGFGHQIHDSFVMMFIDEEEEYAGSIAGDIDDLYTNNRFVNNEWAGVDGVSYGGKAIPESYESMMSYDVPDEFRGIQITFVIDDEISEVRHLNFGDSIPLHDLPILPERQGFYGRWSDESLDNLAFNQTVEAVYKPLIQVISSEEERPKLLVEGIFDPADKLRMIEVDSYKEKVGETRIDEYRIAIDPSESNQLTYRFLKPEQDVILYLEEGGRWVETETQVDGSYLVFKSEHHNFKLALVQPPVNRRWMYILSGLILVIGTLIASKRRRKKVEPLKS
ncbi:hypothetical protein EZV73_00245 [Acidaminobacter sp. JC074]|uniref:hypothetical protein n=1 Tax=Acidaminobacter sp. JC074 TaxID=2530199 RepID=UPI001F0ED2B0|nr:hypothetical protein [Acidaminobacter sp. JC074]MCH4885968.1 hypothetical protein [Acidaminobacter sp. JC074]